MAWSLSEPRAGSTGEGYELSTDFSARFPGDKAHLETGEHTVVLDGVVLNAKAFMRAHGATSLAEALVAAYRGDPEGFLRDLRGTFNGALLDRRQGRWILFVSQIGDRPLFYHLGEAGLFASTDFNAVVDHLRHTGQTVRANPEAARYLLTFGYMIDDATHVEGVRRLLPGDALAYADHRVEVRPYFRFDNTRTLDIGFDEAVEQLDAEFRKAVQRVFDKDLEAGFTSHLADMSGGLDSRMVTWVARAMGYGNICNICYAQSHAPEWRHAMKAAHALDNDFLFLPIDQSLFLFDIEEMVGQNYGLSYYAGITGGKRLLANLNPDRFGLEMTGQLGDAIIGSYVQGRPEHAAPSFSGYRFSTRLRYEFDPRLLRGYGNAELFALQNRGFLGMLTTHLMRNHYTDAVSPYLDVDFLSFCLALPLRYRVGHRLYNAWVARTYPQAARIASSRYSGPVTERMRLSRLRRMAALAPNALLKRVMRLCRIEWKGSPAHMNPFQYWYVTNPRVRSFIHGYYQAHRGRVAPDSPLGRDLALLFEQGTVVEKLMVLTLLATYRRYGLSA